MSRDLPNAVMHLTDREAIRRSDFPQLPLVDNDRFADAKFGSFIWTATSIRSLDKIF